MLDHLELLFGPVGAAATAERLLLGVRQVVISKTGRPPEGLVAQAARVWPIVAVLALMGLQYKRSLEGFAAFFAHIRAQVTVLGIPVGTQSIRSIGTVVTLITGVRLVSFREQINGFITIIILPSSATQKSFKSFKMNKTSHYLLTLLLMESQLTFFFPPQNISTASKQNKHCSILQNS